jgi:hypothetical protein
MIYSRMLYTEHEQPPEKSGEGAFTIFSTQQSTDVNFMPLDVVCLQRFAVLWNNTRDMRLVALIEQSLIIAQLSPVKLLYAADKTLIVVYDHELINDEYDEFIGIWEELVDDVIGERWKVIFVADIGLERCAVGGLFYRYASRILESSTLGILPFTSNMCLFKDEWKPKDLYPYLGRSS